MEPNTLLSVKIHEKTSKYLIICVKTDGFVLALSCVSHFCSSSGATGCATEGTSSSSVAFGDSNGPFCLISSHESNDEYGDRALWWERGSCKAPSDRLHGFAAESLLLCQ